MIPTMADLGGTTKPVRRLPDPTTKFWSAFNPSIAQHPGGHSMMIRSSNYVLLPVSGTVHITTWGSIRSRLWFCDVTAELTLENLREVQFDHGPMTVRRGVEDARLFWREDGWYFTAVMWEPPEVPAARLCLYKFDPETNLATFVTKYDGPIPRRVEKNWMAPATPTDEFDYVYSPSQTFKDGTLQDLGDAPAALDGLRGGSGLLDLDDGTYLAVLHRVSIKQFTQFNPTTFGVDHSILRQYTHHFAQYDAEGRIIALGPEFLFDSPGIEYAAGLVRRGDDLIISYGKEDVSSHLAVLPAKTALSSLEPIQ